MLRLCQPLKQSRLALVNLRIPFSLVVDILLYDIDGCVLTDGVDVKSFRPELTTPQHPLDLGVKGTSNNCHRSSGAPNLLANYSGSFPF